MKLFLAIIFATIFEIRPMPDADAELEPSIQNEVDRAIDLANAWLAQSSCTNALVSEDLFKTNGLTREQKAIKLISLQRGGGWWVSETNAAPTKLAIEILKGL